MSDRVNFEITKRFGVIGENPKTHWTREVNEVSWNGGKPKVDIREWDPEHVKMSRGCLCEIIAINHDALLALNRMCGTIFKSYRCINARIANCLVDRSGEIFKFCLIKLNLKGDFAAEQHDAESPERTSMPPCFERFVGNFIVRQ